MVEERRTDSAGGEGAARRPAAAAPRRPTRWQIRLTVPVQVCCVSLALVCLYLTNPSERDLRRYMHAQRHNIKAKLQGLLEDSAKWLGVQVRAAGGTYGWMDRWTSVWCVLCVTLLCAGAALL